LKIINEIEIGELNIKLYIILVRIFSIKNFFGDWLKIQTKYFSSDL
jgi:ABC-type sulfate transport system substrate-binding protein